MFDIDLLTKTISKMEENQKKKKEIIEYIQEHKPYLLGSVFKSTRIRECCNELRFRDYLNGKQKLYKANFCKYDKFCLACSTRRSIRMINRFTQGIQQYQLYNKYWYHITLTVKHNKEQSLKEVMDKLCEAKEKLGKRYRNGKRNTQKTKSFLNYFDGIVSSIEVSYSESNGRHPYIHILACSDYELPIEFLERGQCYGNKELQRERYELTGDSYQISMRNVIVRDGYFDKNGICEVFKYAVKFSILDVPHLVEIIDLQHTKKYRLFSTYGIFRGWKLDDNTIEDGDFVEKTLVYYEDEYRDVELEQPIQLTQSKESILDSIVDQIDIGSIGE